MTLKHLRQVCIPWLVTLVLCGTAAGASPAALFQKGVKEYRDGNYASAAEAFHDATALKPASGTLQNLGNSEWQTGRFGPAILAWEQSVLLDPFNNLARSNLRFARRTAQIEAPDLSWPEVISSWLPLS